MRLHALARAALLVAFAATAPGAALAHAHLTTATPAMSGSVAASPSELVLGFSEGIDLAFSGITVTGPDGAPVALGRAALRPGSDTTLAVPVPTPLPPGAYSVRWRALAKDGHKTSGAYVFTIAP